MPRKFTVGDGSREDILDFIDHLERLDRVNGGVSAERAHDRPTRRPIFTSRFTTSKYSQNSIVH